MSEDTCCELSLFGNGEHWAILMSEAIRVIAKGFLIVFQSHWSHSSEMLKTKFN